MTSRTVAFEAVASRDNATLKRLRRLAHDPAAASREGVVWLEGDHLIGAWAARGGHGGVLVHTAPVPHGGDAVDTVAAAQAPWLDTVRPQRALAVPSGLGVALSTLPSPARWAALVPRPAAPPLDAHAPTLVLDRVQDAGNVGTLLRSAAAFGVRQVIALEGCALLWSPKVLRAAMGAHFALALHERCDAAALDRLAVPIVGTTLHGADGRLPGATLPWPLAWAFGHEGQGLSADVVARCARRLTIEQPGGEESLNVAAAAAVCLYESWRQRRAAASP